MNNIHSFFFLLGISSLITARDHDSSCHYRYEKKCYGVPSALYQKGPNNPFIMLSGSYTYKTPYQDNMTLAVTNLENPESTFVSPINWIYPQSQYVSGFDASIGFNTFHDGWKISSKYSYFFHSPKIYRNILNNNNYTYWSPFFSESSIRQQYFLQNRIDSKWKIIFQQINLLLQRDFYAGKHLILAPTIGLLSAQDKQNLFIDSENDEPKNQRWTSYQTHFGIGPCLGLNMGYYLFDRVCIFLCPKAAILYSSYYARIQSIRYNQDHSPADLSSAKIIGYTSYKPVELQQVLQTSIGLKIDLEGIDYGVQLHALWDLEVWFDHNKTSPYLINSNNTHGLTNINHSINYEVTGNYYMHGLSAGLGLSF